MSEYRKVPTSPEVYAVICSRHQDELVELSHSEPNFGPPFDPEQAVMTTEFAIKGSSCPLIGARVKWTVVNSVRLEAKPEYWLCVRAAGEQS